MTSLHRRARSLLGLPLALVLAGAGWSPQPQAPTFQAFGPQTFRRAAGAPVPVVARFAVADPLAPYTLRVITRAPHDDRHDRHHHHDITARCAVAAIASAGATPSVPTTTVTLRLRDGAGRAGNAATFAISLVGASSGGGTPVVERFTVDPAVWTRPPAVSYGPNGRGLTTKLRPAFVLGYSDPDGDIERLRVRVTDPLGQTTASEPSASSLRLTGGTGTAQHAFLTLRGASPPGAYQVEVTLIDRAGHLSAPAIAPSSSARRAGPRPWPSRASHQPEGPRPRRSCSAAPASARTIPPTTW